MASFLPAAVATYAAETAGEQPLSTAALGVLDTVCMYELMGCAVDPALLARLARLLGRIETSRHDDRAKHWHRGFAALALKQVGVWRGIAGLPPGPLAFSRGESFGPNVQGLLGYLAAAVEHRATVADVRPDTQVADLRRAGSAHVAPRAARSARHALSVPKNARGPRSGSSGRSLRRRS